MIKEKLENDVKKLKNCIIIFKNGKPKAVPSLEIPITYNGEVQTIGQVLSGLNSKIENQDNIIEIQSKQIQTLREINTMIIDAIKKNNIVSNINNVNIMESIKELGGNI